MASSSIKNALILYFTSQVSDIAADDARKQSKLLKYLAVIGIGYLQSAKRTQEQQQGNPAVSGATAAFSFAQIKKLAKTNEKSWVSLMRQQLQQLQMQQVKDQQQHQQQKYPSRSQDIHGNQSSSSFMPKYKKQFQENAGAWKDEFSKEKKKGTGTGTMGELKCLQLSQSSIHHPSVVSPTSNCPSSCRALALDFLSQNSLQRFEHENVVSHSPASNTPKDAMSQQQNQKEGATTSIPIMESCIINNMGSSSTNNNVPSKAAILELDERDISEQSAANKRIREQRLTPKHTNFVNSLRRNDSEKYVNQQSRKSSISPKHNSNNIHSSNNISAANIRTNIAGSSNNNNTSNTVSPQIALPAYLRNVQSKIADQVRHHRELSKGRVNSPDHEKNSLSPPFKHTPNGSQQFQSINGQNNLGTPIAIAASAVALKTPMNSKNTKNFTRTNNVEMDIDVVDQENAIESLKTCHFRTKSSTSESLLTPTQDLRRKYSQFSQHIQGNNNNNNISSVSKHPFSSTASGSSSSAYNSYKDTFSNIQCENSNNHSNHHHNSHSNSGFFAGSLQSSQHAKNNVLEIAQHFLTSPLMKQLYPKESQQKDLQTQDRLGGTSETFQPTKYGQNQKQQTQQYALNGVNGDKSHLNNSTAKTLLNEGNSQVFKMNSKAQSQQYPSQQNNFSLKPKELSSQESLKRTNKNEVIDESRFQQQRYQWKMSQSGLFNNNDQHKQSSRLLPNDENHNSFSGFKQSSASKPQLQQNQHQSFMSSLSNSNVMSPFHAGEESKIFFRHEFERQIQMKTSSVMMGLDASGHHNNNLSNNSQSYTASKNNCNQPQTPADQSDISFNAGDLSASLFPSSRPLFQH